MANEFDIVLRADDQVSEAIKKIDESVRNLDPQLAKTNSNLKLGGQGTNDNLSDINKHFKGLTALSRDAVQFFGDMVPPLKMASGVAGDFAGNVLKFGAVGALGMGAVKVVKTLATGLGDAAHNAYSLETAAQNSAMSVKDFSQLTGAMHLLGTDTQTAQENVEGLYKTFNDGLQGRNVAVLSAMNTIHAPIIANADGTADVMKTMERLAEIFPKLAPEKQKTVADAIGLTPDVLTLLREGLRYKTLLGQSEAVGLTIDPRTNAELSTFNRQLVEASASWDGLMQRARQKTMHFLLSDGSLNDTVKGFTDGATHHDSAGWGHMLGLNDGPEESEALRKMKGDKKFMETLTPQEKANVGIGRMIQSLRDKYNKYYGTHLVNGWQLDKDRAQNPEFYSQLDKKVAKLQNDVLTVTSPNYSAPANAVADPTTNQSVSQNAQSVRNNNPWNIRYAGQAGATQTADNFAHFQSPELGILSADRQLQLYGSGKSQNVDHPLNTVADIVRVASPARDGNNTDLMIENASKELNVKPDQPLNLSDKGVRSRFLAAVFNQEGNNPYSAEQILSVIQQDKRPSLISSDTQQRQVERESVNAPDRQSTSGSVQQMTPQNLSDAVSSAMKEHEMKVEVTLVNSLTGERQTITGSGGKVSTSMQFP